VRFQLDVRQLTTEELLVCFLIQGVQMVGVAKSFAPNGIADSETNNRLGREARPGFSSACLIVRRVVAGENGSFSLVAGVGFDLTFR
jgi:hypothetical protein